MSALPAADVLPVLDFGGRLDRLRERLPGLACDALLVTSTTNVAYLTGFSGSAAMLLVGPDQLVLVTDGRYRSQAGEELEAAGVGAHLEIGNVGAQRDALRAAAAHVARLGLEAGHVSWARTRAFERDWFPHAELVPTEGVVEELRRVKDDGEVARMEVAAGVADRALEAVKPLLGSGVTERDVALALDVEMRGLGAAGSAFETIVASGPNGARPHARPSSRPIGEGELVVLDFGAVVDGYRSDMTRTLCVGEPASATLTRMVEVVAESQRAGTSAVRAGAAAADVDRACREVVTAAGWADAFVHGTGHGVGLDIHEAPALAASSGDTLAAGHVVTVEPGVYLPGHGGVRIEDTLLVTDGGCRPLTASPKEPWILT